MKLKILFTFLVITSCFLSAYSQVDSGNVEVVHDGRIDLLVKKQSQINRISLYKNGRGEYKGYRIMVLSTNDRNVAYDTRANILRTFPEYGVYMSYQTPYYKIKMGDFLKREDAVKARTEVSRLFTRGTFIVQDIIKLSPEEEERLIDEIESE